MPERTVSSLTATGRGRATRRAALLAGTCALVISVAVWRGEVLADAAPQTASSQPLASTPAPGGTPAWAAKVDQVFAAYTAPGSPGCAVGVFKDGTIAYERGYGMADIEHDVRIAPDTVFYVGSLSKQFTAMAVALAIQQGRLSADDSIHKYLPELPDYGAPITVRHLIHHTSGLRDYNTVLSVAGRRGDEAYDNPTVLRMTARQKHLNFPPGSEYLYSNTGYTLLAIIVERATGTAFASFADERIFKPLGMTVTHYGVDESRIVPRRAYAYARGQAGDVRLDTPHNERAGAGGVFTSVRDLLQWDENFYHARVGGKALVEQLQKTGTLNDGTKLTYAWGLQVMTYRGLNIVEHSGSLGGYRAHLTRFPAQHLSIAALCNGSVSPGGMVRQVADVVLDGTFTAPRPAAPVNGGRGGAPSTARTPAAIPDASSYAGAYFSDEMDTTFTVTVDGGQLMLRRDADSAAAAMVPAADGAFRARGMSMRFERGGDGRAGVLVIDAGRARDIRFVRK